ncbi:hypothetical protein AJ80_07904 [Polytolypa hystricis UAMH7299]|uniref:Phenylacetyl-CoA ligase n=1 Tax=Polytolypa hystricis (strain UAMH7299) TaxID=1447883 RepID=A0A2B7XI56_POLH7|nr:hypothetical protein AJ80_07904 [Polytolypa hystricis UAMH7299]
MTVTIAPAVPSGDIWDLLFERSERPFPQDQVIFQSAETGARRTYEEVRQRAERFAHALSSLWQWQRGDVLAVMAPNDIDTPSVIWGCHYVGGIVAPANPTLSAVELQKQLSSSQARGLVVHPQCLPAAREAVRLAGLAPEHLLVLREDEGTAGHQVITIDQFMASAPPPAAVQTLRQPAVDPAKDVAYLVYSSGTTGQPKGVMISHRNVVAAVVLQSAVDGGHMDWRKDRTLAVLPIYHIYGLICLVHLPMYLGTTTVFMAKFQLDSFCRLIQEHSIMHAYVAPPVVLHLAKNNQVDNYNLGSLRMLTSGGAPLAATLITELYQLRRLPVRQAYGLSETTSVFHIQRWDSWQSGMGSNGPPLPGLEARIVVDDAHTANEREEGELWVRGPTVFPGYRDDPELTVECLTTDGWFKTGDVGYEDQQGNFFITDRIKDMIKFKGYQVAPAELENVLLRHSAVDDAAVIGVMNPDLASEVPLAYIVLKQGQTEDETTAHQILDLVKECTAHYKHLRGGIIWTKQLPRSPSGKIMKRELRDRAATVDRGRHIAAMEYTRYTARLAKL